MRVQCQQCCRWFEDAEFLTYCPHDPLGGSYCREHDLFYCSICTPAEATPLGATPAKPERTDP